MESDWDRDKRGPWGEWDHLQRGVIVVARERRYRNMNGIE
jgi:hypothetical protein